MTPTIEQSYRTPVWPDRSHRTLAEVWNLTAEEVEQERRAFVPGPRDWRRVEPRS